MTKTLIDTKYWRSWPNDREFSCDSILDQARRQLNAANISGASVQWYMPSGENADLVRGWLSRGSYNTNIVLTPEQDGR